MVLIPATSTGRRPPSYPSLPFRSSSFRGSRSNSVEPPLKFDGFFAFTHPSGKKWADFPAASEFAWRGQPPLAFCSSIRKHVPARAALCRLALVFAPITSALGKALPCDEDSGQSPRLQLPACCSQFPDAPPWNGSGRLSRKKINGCARPSLASRYPIRSFPAIRLTSGILAITRQGTRTPALNPRHQFPPPALRVRANDRANVSDCYWWIKT